VAEKAVPFVVLTPGSQYRNFWIHPCNSLMCIFPNWTRSSTL